MLIAKVKYKLLTQFWALGLREEDGSLGPESGRFGSASADEFEREGGLCPSSTSVKWNQN